MAFFFANPKEEKQSYNALVLDDMADWSIEEELGALSRFDRSIGENFGELSGIDRGIVRN